MNREKVADRANASGHRRLRMHDELMAWGGTGVKLTDTLHFNGIVVATLFHLWVTTTNEKVKVQHAHGLEMR